MFTIHWGPTPVNRKNRYEQMDGPTGNKILGWPTYDVVRINGASYREIRLTEPDEQSLFNCFQWKRPQGTQLKARFNSAGGNHGSTNQYNNRNENLSSDFDDEEGLEESHCGDLDIEISSGSKPECFDEDQELEQNQMNRNEEFIIDFNESQSSWITIVPFPKSHVGILIGRKQSNLQLLETGTHTRIVVTPIENKAEEVSVTITSTISRECVGEAMERVLKIASKPLPMQQDQRFNQRQPKPMSPSSKPPSRMPIRYTHFISLPIRENHFKNQFNSFKAQALRNSTDLKYHGINSSLFQIPSRLHLTLFMLNLDSSDKAQLCGEILLQSQVRRIKTSDETYCASSPALLDYILIGFQAAIYDAVDTRSVVLEFRGIEVMNDDETNANIVVTCPLKSTKYEKINHLAGILMENLINAGLASWDQFHQQRCLASDGSTIDIKLHATLLNTKYASINQAFKTKRSQPIDFAQLVHDFKFLSFGNVNFKEVHLSSLLEFENEYYKCIAQCKLP